jgi:hypothetical protein
MGDDAEQVDNRVKQDHDREQRLGISYGIGLHAPTGGAQQNQDGTSASEPDIQLPPARAPVVNLTVPITMPKADGSSRTVVTKLDANGRIKEFERHVIEP